MKNNILNWDSLKRFILFIFQNSHYEAKTEVVKFDYLVSHSEYMKDEIYEEAFDACIFSITNLKFEKTYKKRFGEFMNGKFGELKFL